MQFIVLSPGRLDTVLASQTSLSRSRVRRAIDLELVEVNGVAALKPAVKVLEGDSIVIDIDALPVEGISLEPTDLRLPVLYEDAACMVINKPAKIAVHPGSGMQKDETTLLHGIAFLMKERGLPFSSETALVHRIDKDTTGCLLIAKTAAAHRLLQEQFAARTVGKIYLAIVAGVPREEKALIDAPVGRHTANRTKMAVMGASAPREARTGYEILSAGTDVALVQCTLHTGRTHQIRVHMSAIDHPLLGDATYGSDRSATISEKYGAAMICLHAWKLEFYSPAVHSDIAVVADPPEAFVEVMKRAGLEKQIAGS